MQKYPRLLKWELRVINNELVLPFWSTQCDEQDEIKTTRRNDFMLAFQSSSIIILPRTSSAESPEQLKLLWSIPTSFNSVTKQNLLMHEEKRLFESTFVVAQTSNRSIVIGLSY